MGSMEDEIEQITVVSEDGTEIAYVFRRREGGPKLTTAEIIMELECLISDMARADDALKQPGVRLH
jgi:hypothetical protein